ncbi:MAG: maleylpyruvate isomerase family mycothiol-dependent enzyme [Gordonia sp. (in: high G+C Gram-positive bacteria)]
MDHDRPGRARQRDVAEWLAALDASLRRLLDTLEPVADEDLSALSLIPPWTRGHVLAHLCRAGDSVIRLLDWARTGIEVPQYPSMAARAADIEAGARRPLAEQRDDLVAGAARLDRCVRALPDAAWSATVRPRTGEPRTPAGILLIRLREVEIHHVDLDLGYSVADIPDEDARWILDDLLDALARQPAPPALTVAATDGALTRSLGAGSPPVSGPPADLLAWLSGRADAAGLALTSADGGPVPPAPRWI